jgi:two-component system sensor histidine kinase DegS
LSISDSENLFEHVVNAEQDERRRLSVALHDGPVQSLAGIALIHDAALEALRSGRVDEAQRLLEGALEKERETIQTLRDLSFAMEPVVLRDLGFEAATRALAEQLSDSRDIAISLDVAAGDRLGRKVQVALYQVLREALAQAERRRPLRIAVSVVETTDGDFEATVEDDGRSERRRDGVAAVEDRARLLGARVAVETGEGGTVVKITLPGYATGS